MTIYTINVPEAELLAKNDMMQEQALWLCFPSSNKKGQVHGGSSVGSQLRVIHSLLTGELVVLVVQRSSNIGGHEIINIWCEEGQDDSKAGESDRAEVDSPESIGVGFLVCASTDCKNVWCNAWNCLESSRSADAESAEVLDNAVGWKTGGDDCSWDLSRDLLSESVCENGDVDGDEDSADEGTHGASDAAGTTDHLLVLDEDGAVSEAHCLVPADEEASAVDQGDHGVPVVWCDACAGAEEDATESEDDNALDLGLPKWLAENTTDPLSGNDAQSMKHC